MKFILVTLLMLGTLGAFAQEIDATVAIDARQLRSEDRATFSTFTQQVQEYINGHQWTGTTWPRPKVRMSIQVSITQSLGDGAYAGQVLVVSQRPQDNSEQLSPMVRVLDPNWQFNYSRGEPMYHNQGVFSSVTSMFDFYAYLALGCDADTRADLGGTDLYRRAYDICVQGQSSAKATGWALPTGGGYTRFAYVGELLDPRFEMLRHLSYSYHAAGIDQQESNPATALHALHGVVDSLLLFKSAISGPSVSLDRFLDAKYLELAAMFVSDPDKSTVYQELQTIDPSHQSYYEENRVK